MYRKSDKSAWRLWFTPSIRLGLLLQRRRRSRSIVRTTGIGLAPDVDPFFHFSSVLSFQTVVGFKQPLFEVFENRPRNMPPLHEPIPHRSVLPEESKCFRIQKPQFNARILLGFTELPTTADESGKETDDEYDIIDSRELSDMS